MVERNILEKLDILDLKYDVLSIIYSLQFDGVYNMTHCIEDLNNLMIKLDRSEADYSLILNRYKSKNRQEQASEEEIPLTI